MRIGLFTDAYLPDINGVVSSVATLKHALEELVIRYLLLRIIRVQRLQKMRMVIFFVCRVLKSRSFMGIRCRVLYSLVRMPTLKEWIWM